MGTKPPEVNEPSVNPATLNSFSFAAARHA